MSHAFRAAVEARDLDAMRDALHPEVVFRSPVVFKPYEGRDTVMHLLSAVLRVFENFRYLDELEGPTGTQALIFQAEAGGRSLHGLDYLQVDAAGLVTELWVMVRPLSGLSALAQAMASELGVSPQASA